MRFGVGDDRRFTGLAGVERFTGEFDVRRLHTAFGNMLSGAFDASLLVGVVATPGSAVELDDDPGRGVWADSEGGLQQPLESPRGLSTVTVRDRVRVGYDADGVPEFEWIALATDVEALFLETKVEVHGGTGLTMATATMEIAWPTAKTAPRETAEVLDSLGRTWSVIGAKQVADGLRLTAERTEGEVAPGVV